MNNSSSCIKLREFLQQQSKIILKHIDEHKWYKHIEDYNKGIIDFINSYGWLMRETLCGSCCSNKDTCDIAKEYRGSDEDIKKLLLVVLDNSNLPKTDIEKIKTIINNSKDNVEYYI